MDNEQHPPEPENSADPLCPDCNQPFNAIADFRGRLNIYSGIGGGKMNVYICPHCKHNIYRFPDGTPAAREGSTDES